MKLTALLMSLATYLAIILPGSAILRVCVRAFVGTKTADGFEVSSKLSLLSPSALLALRF
jgi:hypothetical protein